MVKVSTWIRSCCRCHSGKAALALALAGAGILAGQAPKITEYQVKAAYLANFGKFVEWPDQGASASRVSFYLCVLGQDPFGADLDAAVAGETIGQAKLQVKRIPRAQEAAECRIVFISSSEAGRCEEILAALPTSSSALTVSDMPQFTRCGGIVQFLTHENRVRFDVNLGATRRARLILSSELLKLAVNVRK